jgi:hypothetical protein
MNGGAHRVEVATLDDEAELLKLRQLGRGQRWLGHPRLRIGADLKKKWDKSTTRGFCDWQHPHPMF